MASLHTLFSATAATLFLFTSAPGFAHEEHPEGMHIHDVYARTNGGIGKTGAIFFMVHNNTDQDDRLADVRADVAQKVELHTHAETADGVMQMLALPEGIPLPAGEMHELARGGDHVMLMGLTRDLKDGDHFPLTLVFDQAGEITVDAVVDNARKPGEMGQDHMQMHGAMTGAQPEATPGN
jgi:periplasmic copper chaperone A